MPVALNKTIETLPVSVSMQFHNNARAMKAADPTLIDLSAGEPDFDTPAPVLSEGIAALRAGETRYAVAQGLPALRETVAKKLQTENGCRYAPEEILITPGSKFALYLALRTLVSPGDRVLYPVPAYVSYGPMILAAGGIPVPVELSHTEGYRLTKERLKAAFSAGAKAVLINYPNNPTGNILTDEEACLLRDCLLASPGTAVICDEIYEKIVFDKKKSVSMAAFPELYDRAVTVNGFSKTFSMTGWRAGYLAAPAYMLRAALKLQQHSVISVPPFTQLAALKALSVPEETERMRAVYEARRNRFIGALNAIPGVSCSLPEGAFYAWVRFPGYSLPSDAMADYILKAARVVSVPGNAYGTEDGAVRFCFAREEAVLAEAAERIKAALGSLPVSV